MFFYNAFSDCQRGTAHTYSQLSALRDDIEMIQPLDQFPLLMCQHKRYNIAILIGNMDKGLDEITFVLICKQPFQFFHILFTDCHSIIP